MLVISGLVTVELRGRRLKGEKWGGKATPRGPLQRITTYKVPLSGFIVSDQVNSIFDQCQVIFVYEQLNPSNTTQILSTPHFSRFPEVPASIAIATLPVATRNDSFLINHYYSRHSPITSNLNMRGVTMANTNKEKLSILRRKKVEKRTGLSRSTIYVRIQEGTFPRPINLGARAVGWLENEIEAWLAERMKIRDKS